MTDMHSLLAGVGGEEEYLANDPYFRAGHGVSQWNIRPQTNAEALWAPALQGLLAGTLTGFGREGAADAQFRDIRDSGMAKLLGPQYAGEERPSDLTPRVMQRDNILAALTAQNQRENELKQLESNQAIEKLLMGKGAMFDPVKGLVPVPGLAGIEASAAEEAAKRKKIGEIVGENQGYEQTAPGAANPNSPFEKKTTELRTDFDKLPEVKNFKYVQRLSNQLVETMKNPSAVADPILAKMVVQFVEPEMAVNAGESAGLAASTSIPEAWKGKIQQALDGKSVFSDEIRKGLVDIAKAAYLAHSKSYGQTSELYKGEASRFGIPFERISSIGAPVTFDALTAGQGLIKMRTLKDGTTVKVQQQPDGSYIEVE